MEDIIHLWDGEKWNGPITDGHLHLDRKGRCLNAAIDFSLMVFLPFLGISSPISSANISQHISGFL